MRLSEFWRLVDDEFGTAYGRVLAGRQVLSAVGGRTAEEALAAGVSPRSIWLALCDAMDVPEDRRLGVDRRPRRGRPGQVDG